MESNWKAYGESVGAQTLPVCSNEPAVKFPTTSDDLTGKTGFQDLIPQKPELQARYDAMSGEWEGVEPSNSAVIKGLFTSGPAPIDKTLPDYKKVNER
jgi:hypothetical protein